jgi:hypothetical protein
MRTTRERRETLGMKTEWMHWIKWELDSSGLGGDSEEEADNTVTTNQPDPTPTSLPSIPSSGNNQPNIASTSTTAGTTVSSTPATIFQQMAFCGESWHYTALE